MAIIQKSFSDLVDFTRGSEATGWVNGQLKIFGINEPRFVTNPDTGYSGLLLEPFASTNLLTNSDVVVDQTIIVPSGNITLSFYGEGEVSFTGAATGALQGAGGNARATITVTAAAGALVLSVTDGSPILGQLEAGTKATSYIPTGGSQVTRAGDRNMVSIPSQNSNREGSLCIDLTSFVFVSYSAALFANNPPEGYLLLCGGRSTSEGIKYGVALATLAGDAFFPLSGLEENKRHKLSVGWSGRSFVAFLDGAKAVDEIDVGFDIPSFNELNLFSNSDVGLASGAAGMVNRVAYYTERLTDAQLAALTEI